MGAVLHIFPVVNISLGPPPLADNVHNLAIDNHCFEHRVLSMKPVAEIHDTLVEVDKPVVGVVDVVDTVEDVLLCVVVGFGQVGYLGF